MNHSLSSQHTRQPATQRSLSRRAFFKASWLAASGMVFLPAIQFSTAGHTNLGALDVGVLAPESTLHPELGLAWLAGMQTYLNVAQAAGDRPLRLVTAPAGMTPESAAAAARSLLQTSQ